MMNLREYAQQQKNGTAGIVGPQNGTECKTGSVQQAQQLPEEYRSIYRAVFDFHARHSSPQSAEEWQAAAAEVVQISAAHGNRQFVTDLLMAVFSEIDRSSKTNRQNIDDIPF